MNKTQIILITGKLDLLPNASAIPIGKARIAQHADSSKVDNGESCVVISYGRGIHWTLEASKDFKDKVEVLDLRTLSPLDEKAISEAVKRHNKVLLVTEESEEASFTLGISGRIQRDHFMHLDAPVMVLGSIDTLITPHKLRTLAYKTPETTNAGLDVYVDPVKGHDYALTVDVARGDGADFSVFTIIDFTTMEQVVPLILMLMVTWISNLPTKASTVENIRPKDVGYQVGSLVID